MTNRPRLLSPYPGAKNPDRYPVHDGGQYDCWVAPFAGSGEQEAWIAKHYPCLPVIAADADSAVRAVWECWGDAELRQQVFKRIDRYAELVMADPVSGFARLKQQIEHHWLGAPYDGIDLAAVSMLLRRLTFGGVIRSNAQGELNVGLSPDKLKTFQRQWTFEDHLFQWPQPPRVLTVFEDWGRAVDFVAGHDHRTPETNHENAIAIVDPPYCAGTTDAYAQASGELQMALDCVDLLLASGNVSRLVAFNYWGEWVAGEDAPREYPIVAAMQRIADEHRVEMHFSRLGTLATMNNGPGKTAVHRFEGVWEIGGQRMFWPQQLHKPETKVYEQLAFV